MEFILHIDCVFYTELSLKKITYTGEAFIFKAR